MTRVEAEAIAARLVTVEQSRPPFVNRLIVMAGVVVGLELHDTDAQRRTSDMRDAIVRALLDDVVPR